MNRSRVSLPACSAGVFLIALLGSAGCGGKDASSTAGSSAAVPPGGAEMPAQARSAMETQQKAEAADRALHTKRP